MRKFLESDTGFYLAVGAFTTAVFVCGMLVLALTTPDAVRGTEMLGFVGGFLLFMVVFVISLSIQRLEDGDGSGTNADSGTDSGRQQ